MTTEPQRAPARSRGAMAAPFRLITALVSSYLALSILTVVALSVLSAVAPAQVNSEAWVRGVIVAGTSMLTFVFARRASRSSRALLRLRIVALVIFIAVVAVLFFLTLPLWMVVEQIVCGLLLLATIVLVFRAREAAPALGDTPAGA